MDDKNSPKLAKNFFCEICEYTCCKQSDLDKHIMTLKHKKRTKELHFLAKKEVEPKQYYQCECGKKYKYRQGLWKHNKICNNNEKFQLKYFSSNEELI